MIKLAVTHFNSYIQDHCVLSLTSLEKQGRPGSVRGHLRIQRFNEDPLLCPVAALVEYDRQVSLLTHERETFFVSFCTPHACVTVQTLTGWSLLLEEEGSEHFMKNIYDHPAFPV